MEAGLDGFDFQSHSLETPGKGERAGGRMSCPWTMIYLVNHGVYLVNHLFSFMEVMKLP